jgi:hypothetical protein
MINCWLIIGGCPRSGTTLLGNALGAGQDAIVTPEAQFASDLLCAVESGQVQPSRDEMADFVRGHWRFKIWDEPFPVSMPDCSTCSNAFEVAAAVLQVVISEYALRRGKPGATVWIDQTPRHLGFLPTILKVPLKVSAVHIVRDGRGVASSVAKLDWGPTSIISLSYWWAAEIAKGFAALELLPERRTTVKYEDLLKDPETKIKGTCQALSLPYSADMLRSQALKVVNYTKSQHAAVGGPWDSRRATSWRKDLRPREQEIFESISGTLLALLGYPLVYHDPRPPTPAERLYLDLARHTVIRRMRRLRRSRRIADHA